MAKSSTEKEIKAKPKKIGGSWAVFIPFWAIQAERIDPKKLVRMSQG